MSVPTVGNTHARVSLPYGRESCLEGMNVSVPRVW